MNYPNLIGKLQKKGIVPGLLAMNNLLEVLGHPEEALRVVHIAGTNGKGSILAFLSSVLQEAGYKTGRYTSPAISCYEERFQINGSNIKKDQLRRYFSIIEKAVSQLEKEKKATPTLFEAETAIAFLYFKEEKTDFALIETGMGGLLDATNAVKHPALTVIASISYDHMAYLGDTLTEIAKQKAGIIKPGVPVIVSENPEEALSVIKEMADRSRSSYRQIMEGEYRVLTEGFDGSSFLWKGTEYHILLPGRHQIANAVTALCAAKHLLSEMPQNDRGDFSREETALLQKDAMLQGLRKTRWPGRLELIKSAPLIFRDGAHNPDGARKLADFLQKHFTNRRILYIMGVLKDKDYERMLAYLLPLSDKAFVFRPDNVRGLDAETLAECVRSFGKEAVICDDVNHALQAARGQAGLEDVLVVCGSLSFMEEMR